jgi:hypothetical protein
MDFRWARTNMFLLVLLAIAVVTVGVLTTLVMYQQHDQRTVNGQVRLETDPTVPAANFPDGADIGANPNAVTHLDPTTAATTPDPANAPVGLASQPALASPALQVAPPPSPQTPLKPKTLPHRRVNPVPAPHPPASAHLIAPAPQTDPNPLPRSNTPVKPGSPEGW